MLVVWLAALVSLASFFYCLRHGTVLLYGDAVAHINIARRVFDSRTPGLQQMRQREPHRAQLQKSRGA